MREIRYTPPPPPPSNRWMTRLPGVEEASVDRNLVLSISGIQTGHVAGWVSSPLLPMPPFSFLFFFPVFFHLFFFSLFLSFFNPVLFVTLVVYFFPLFFFSSPLSFFLVPFFPPRFSIFFPPVFLCLPGFFLRTCVNVLAAHREGTWSVCSFVLKRQCGSFFFSFE